MHLMVLSASERPGRHELHTRSHIIQWGVGPINMQFQLHFGCMAYRASCYPAKALLLQTGKRDSQEQGEGRIQCKRFIQSPCVASLSSPAHTWP